ncbi:MAG TPA: DNA-binding domain-containing protein [Anseongella sp.]|nr:DNA-binding domain-containing protein [Anseongella sp.]
MPFRFYLQPNLMTPDPADQLARVVPNATLNLDAIVARILKRGTLVTQTDALAVLNIFFDVVSDEVAAGNAVLLPLMNLRPSIKGSFLNIMDTFDRSRHTLRASASAGILMNRKLQDATAEKIAAATLTGPLLLEYLDVNTGLINSALTPGGIGQVVGDHLKYDAANPDEGIFLLEDGGAETKVTVVANRTDKRLVFNVPNALPPGDYTLEVRRAYGKDLTLRTGQLNAALTTP